MERVNFRMHCKMSPSLTAQNRLCYMRTHSDNGCDPCKTIHRAKMVVNRTTRYWHALGPYAFLRVLLAMPFSSFALPCWAAFFLERASLFKISRHDMRSINVYRGNESDVGEDLIQVPAVVHRPMCVVETDCPRTTPVPLRDKCYSTRP